MADWITVISVRLRSRSISLARLSDEPGRHVRQRRLFHTFLRVIRLREIEGAANYCALFTCERTAAYWSDLHY